MGLHCLPMSNKKDAGRILVNILRGLGEGLIGKMKPVPVVTAAVDLMLRVAPNMCGLLCLVLGSLKRL